MHEAGVYIHIPFCAAKCIYCDFLSFPGSRHLYEHYINSLTSEIRAAHIEKVTTVFIGGGTPSVLPAGLMQDLLNCVFDLRLAGDAEVSIEINPDTVTKDYLKLLKSAGVNRLSIGLQSDCNQMLALLGRVHSYEQFLENFYSAMDIGFDNINVDLMFNLPSQTTAVFYETLSVILALQPRHISFYSLTPCEDTPLWHDLSAGRLSLPDDYTDRSMYHSASKLLTSNGYLHYEISNAAKPGFECRHNIDCWKHKPYFGFGLGAHSFDGKRRWSNPSTFSDYFSRAKLEIQLLTNEEILSEAMILGLRLLDGINEPHFESKYKVKPSVYFSRQISHLVCVGLVECSGNYIRLTSLGLDLANRVFMQFLRGD